MRLRKRAAGLLLGAAVLFLIGTNVQAGWLYVIAALLLGAILGGLLISIKKVRAKYNLEPVSDHDALRVTPSSSTP